MKDKGRTADNLGTGLYIEDEAYGTTLGELTLPGTNSRRSILGIS
jgi:hypothetical protein